MTLVVVGWLLGWVLLWRLPHLDRARAAAAPVEGGDGPPSRGSRVSVVVPARNEADRLPRLLASLARQTRPADEVVVVDDGSTDGTGEVAAAHAGVRVVPAAPVPDGWAGKPWACATGVGVTDGELLVFLDADVELADDALEAVVATHCRLGGLVSVQPHHRIGRPVEALSLPFNVVAMMGLGVGSLVRTREWGAAGPCLAIDRALYDAVGGHAAVRADVAEDLALAAQVAAAGEPVHTVAGGDRVRFRMYRDLRGVVEGWGKNLATGAGRTPLMRALGIAVWVAALLTVAWQAVGALAGWGPDPVVTGAAYGAVALQVGVLGSQVGRFGPAALAWPVLLVFFVAVFATSALRTLVVRRVRWSGRTLDLAPRR